MTKWVRISAPVFKMYFKGQERSSYDLNPKHDMKYAMRKLSMMCFGNTEQDVEKYLLEGCFSFDDCALALISDKAISVMDQNDWYSIHWKTSLSPLLPIVSIYAPSFKQGSLMSFQSLFLQIKKKNADTCILILFPVLQIIYNFLHSAFCLNSIAWRSLHLSTHGTLEFVFKLTFVR